MMLSDHIDQILVNMEVQQQMKGAIASVVVDGENELCQGYGFALEESGKRSDPDLTAFRVGSISKVFVAIAVLQQEEKGMLRMDEPISVYLDADFPKFKYEITMEHLLTHTAGFEDMISGVAINDISKAEPLKLSIRKYKPNQEFVPGQVVSYSNYGIALAAYVVECITGQDFASYAEAEIFRPLNMTKTSFKLDYDGALVSNAYDTNGKETTEPLINIYPEGSMVSTAADMAKCMIWLMDDTSRVLKAASKKKLFEQHFTMADEFQGMGLTWNIKERNDHLFYDKKGETVNFISRIVLYPEQKTGVFISFNTFVGEKVVDEIMENTTTLLLGPETTPIAFKQEQTKEIGGFYLATRSNFQTVEKITNAILDRGEFWISGNLTDGFKMNNEKLVPIGENYYRSPIGNLKYVETDERVYMATDSASSYIRTNWYESRIVQLLNIALFFALSFIMAALAIRNLILRKNEYLDLYQTKFAIINVIMLSGIVLLIVRGYANFSIIDSVEYLKFFGAAIIITSVTNIFNTTQMIIKRETNPAIILIAAFNLSSILFSLWMMQVNIL